MGQMIGGILFLACLFFLSVCLFVCLHFFVNFNILSYFWTIRDEDFTIGMHTPLMIPFQMTPRSKTLTLTFILKLAFLDFAVAEA